MLGLSDEQVDQVLLAANVECQVCVRVRCRLYIYMRQFEAYCCVVSQTVDTLDRVVVCNRLAPGNRIIGGELLPTTIKNKFKLRTVINLH